MLLPDLRYAFRALARSPGFAALAVLALALGIGATTTMFGAIDAVVLGAYRGVPRPGEVVQVWDRYANTEPGREVQVSVPNFEDYRERQRVFSHIAAFQPTPLYLETDDGQLPLRGLHFSADLLTILGVEPALGRAFTAEDDEPGAAPVVMITHGLWQRRFGGDPGVIGRTVRLARFVFRQGWVAQSYEIGAVLPPDFRLPPLRLRHAFEPLPVPDVILPMGLWTWGRGDRGMHAFRVLGRLAPGVSLEQAQAQLSAVAAGVARAHPETNQGYDIVVTRLPELVRQAHGRRMAILMAAAVLVLLIACANVAGLLLGRAVSRERELAIRAALGAGRRRLLRQLLTESLVLALMGGAAGLVIAYWLTRLLDRVVPPGIHNLDAVRLDGRVLAFALAVAVGTTLLSGLLPGLRGARADANQTLRAAIHGASRVRARGLRSLVVAQVAIAFALLSGAGLLLASLANLLRSDPGFRGEDVILYQIRMLPPPFTKYAEREAQRALFEQVSERLRGRPDVIAVATVNNAPLEGREPSSDFTLADRPPPSAEERATADWISASPDYFSVMGIAVLEGRGFAAEDHAATASPRAPGRPLPELPAIINDRMAKLYWPGESALGKLFYWGIQSPTTVAAGSYETGEWDRRYPAPFPLRIVGVVRQVNMLGLGDEQRLQYYTLDERLAARWLAVRVRGDPAAVTGSIRAAVAGVDPEIEIADVVLMRDRVSDAAATMRFQLFTIGGFGILALLLATVGLFGVVAFLVRQRTHEFGVRLALGAQRHDVVRLVLAQGLRLAGLGLAIGMLAFLAGARVLASLLYGITPFDARALFVGAAILGIAAVAACLAPALRAARTDPMRTLNYE